MIKHQSLYPVSYTHLVEANPGHDIGVVTLTGRLVKLQICLLYTSYSNDIISAECVFSSRTYLYRIFKLKEGCTPTEWREKKAENHSYLSLIHI